MSFTIIKAGLLDTIQDLGRYGFGSWGVNPGGAMDLYAAQLANILTGNETHEAILEIHFPGPQILFEQSALIAVTGGDFNPLINDQPISLWQPVLVRRNTILHFPQRKQGARCYLAVHGGLAINKWLNSYSTNTKAVAGGWEGRKLEKGDEIQFGESRIYYAGLLQEGKDLQPLGWKANIERAYDNPNEISFTPGKEWNQLHEHSKKDLLSRDFFILTSSDRMGYQLKGKHLTMQQTTEILSSAVSFGTMQLFPRGQLIVLMADHQTTGGYPRVGHIISAHLSKLAQLKPGDRVRFKMTSIEDAETSYFFQENELNILKRSCNDNLNKKGMLKVDLNSDLGESTSLWPHAIDHDISLLQYISSANIACGYHAGDPDTIKKLIQEAMARNVAIGAHPSFSDRENFGRKEMFIDDKELYRIVYEQIKSFAEYAIFSGTRIQHVKLYGALYNMASRDIRLAHIICSAIQSFDEDLIIYGLSGSAMIAVADGMGMKTCNEVFADRTYQDDGHLTSRTDPKALIEDEEKCIQQVLQMILQGNVCATSGKNIPVKAETICIHSDGLHSLSFGKALYERLQQYGIIISPPE